MYYKTTVVSPNRTSSPSPIVLRKASQFQPLQQNTYFTSMRTTPIKNQEQRFEPTTDGIKTQYSQITPEKTTKKEHNVDVEIQILRNDLTIREQEIVNLQRALECANEDRYRLRSALEQKTISCVNKEREIVKLLATIHQLEMRRQDIPQVKDLQTQIEMLKQYIQQTLQENARKSTLANIEEATLAYKNKLLCCEEENEKLLREIDQMQRYSRELMLQNKEFQQKYQNKCLECQKLEIENDQIAILQKQLKGKEEQIEILKYELKNSSKEVNSQQNSTLEQNNEIQNFLSQIKKQYFDESSRHNYESDCASFDQNEFKHDYGNDDEQEKQIQQPVYSFQTKTDE